MFPKMLTDRRQCLDSLSMMKVLPGHLEVTVRYSSLLRNERSNNLLWFKVEFFSGERTQKARVLALHGEIPGSIPAIIGFLQEHTGNSP